MALSSKVKTPIKNLPSISASEVVKHKKKEDLYIVIHDKEVLVDQGGVDATEAFEEVGHSEDARQQLAELLVGTLNRQVTHGETLASSGKAYKRYHANPPSSSSAWTSARLVLAVIIAAFFVCRYLLS